MVAVIMACDLGQPGPPDTSSTLSLGEPARLSLEQGDGLGEAACCCQLGLYLISEELGFSQRRNVGHPCVAGEPPHKGRV